ncbi:unnamed protein product [Alopecurus aequalis]
MALIASSVAVAALVLLALQLPAAAAAEVPPPPHNCPTKCGAVSVHYPFGIMGSSPGCYWPGLNLTCADDTRLLLGDGSLHVQEIFINNGTVRVMHTGGDIEIDERGYGAFGGGLRDHGPYTLCSGNELILVGCNVYATLREKNNHNIIGGCASFCPNDGPGTLDDVAGNVVFKWLDEAGDAAGPSPRRVFVAEEGWFDQNTAAANLTSIEDAVPLLLHWALLVEEDRAPVAGELNCTNEEAGRVCKSNNSTCKTRGRGYTCSCQPGYQDNPYKTDGCIIVPEDECEGCVDPPNRVATGGSVRCRRCALYASYLPNRLLKTINSWLDDIWIQPSRGYHFVFVYVVEHVAIGLGVGSGVGFVVLILTIFVMVRKFKVQRARMKKRKFFQQNRGQLLQQLVSQRADIAERMIITLEELEKATNNFDKSRELGGGGHVIVYKGILSDLHVVAIKKPKLVVQKEIDEFINEVAILSQVNHRNVVKLHGCFLETEVPMLVYEFVSNGTLYDHLHVRSLSWIDRLRIAIETAKSLAYLHCAVSMPIIHRDIKFVNILLDDTLTAKVADFGASRYIPIENSGVITAVQGTIGYLDPMYFYTSRLTDKSDVYSFGVVLIELLTRRKPFSYMTSEGDSLVANFVTLLAEGNVSQILDPRLIDEGGKEIEEVATLAVACVKLKGENRPTMMHVELTLEAIQTSRYPTPISPEVENYEMDHRAINFQSTNAGRNNEDLTRQYSLEQEFMLSANYPR